MNNELRFTDFFLLVVGFWVLLGGLYYASGSWTPENTQELMGLVHSVVGVAHHTSHAAHVGRHALGQSAANWNYVMQGHSVIPGK